MRRFPIRYLIFLSGTILILSCNHYRHLQKTGPGGFCVQKFKPDFHSAMYKTSVDVTGKHFSGLLLIKNMPDSSTHIVFTNEMGFSFFEFGFLPDNGFRVYQVTPKMNKKALIRTLRKDFELILFRNMDSTRSYSLTDSQLVYHAYPQTKGVNYYITNIPCSHLVKMQRASDKKPVVEAMFEENNPGLPPDSIFIKHLNFNFSITLIKIPKLAPQ